MARRADPTRIDEARQAATRNRLIGTGLDESTADTWIAAWEAQATRTAYHVTRPIGEAGWRWIAEQRAARRHADD